MRALALASLLAGCALAHERGGDASAPDARSLGADCETFWRGLSSCPATRDAAIGQACVVEGATCGARCCEPGPPIACTDGHWTALDHTADCSGVRCMAPVDCMGGGRCAADRTCLLDTTGPGVVSWCVNAPRPWPAGAIDADTRCRPTCTAHGGPGPTTVVIAPSTSLFCP